MFRNLKKSWREAKALLSYWKCLNNIDSRILDVRKGRYLCEILRKHVWLFYLLTWKARHVWTQGEKFWGFEKDKKRLADVKYFTYARVKIPDEVSLLKLINIYWGEMNSDCEKCLTGLKKGEKVHRRD